MYNPVCTFNISCFRNRAFAWIMLTILCIFFLPSVSLAQQPTATIKTMDGEVLVSGQTAAMGTVLQADDTIQTQAGGSVVLKLSDGSEIHLGENTQVNMADLTQTAAGERISRLTLLRGWLRAMLSPGHQKEGSSFTVETPNAQIGVKFSQPDVEVSYDPEKQETIGIAHTVELLAKNLLTDETKLVPVGSSVIIIGMVMKVIAGTSAAAIAAGTETAATAAATGIGTGTMVAVGVGAAAAGGVVAVAASSGDEGGSDVSFTGTFVNENNDGTTYWVDTFNLIQNGTSITGTYDISFTNSENCCTVNCPSVPVTGTVNGTSATLTHPDAPGGPYSCEGNNCRIEGGCQDAGSWACTLVDNGRILRGPYGLDFIRQ